MPIAIIPKAWYTIITESEKKPQRKQARGCKENRQITAMIARREGTTVQQKTGLQPKTHRGNVPHSTPQETEARSKKSI